MESALAAGDWSRSCPSKPGQGFGQTSVLVSAAAFGTGGLQSVPVTLQAELGKDLWEKAGWILWHLINIFSIAHVL